MALSNCQTPLDRLAIHIADSPYTSGHGQPTFCHRISEHLNESNSHVPTTDPNPLFETAFPSLQTWPQKPQPTYQHREDSLARYLCSGNSPNSLGRAKLVVVLSRNQPFYPVVDLGVDAESCDAYKTSLFSKVPVQ